MTVTAATDTQPPTSPALISAVFKSRVRSDLSWSASSHRGEFSPMLLKTCQHCEIALIQHRTAVPLDIAGARALLLLGSTVLRHGGAGRDKQQSDDRRG